MKLHTVVVSYERLHLTQQTVASYLETVTLPHTLLIVDNGSSPEVTDWLRQSGHPHLLLGANRYPGYACNRGFALAPDDADLLHRSDNDMLYLPGWCQHLENRLRHKKVGLVGLRTRAEEGYTDLNTGGTAVIRRELWQQGLRYNDEPWSRSHTEDWEICQQVKQMGYQWTRVKQPSVVHIASGDLNDPYYLHSYSVRNIIS